MLDCQFFQFYSYSAGLTLECQSQNSSSHIWTYIELLASFFVLIWTYPQLLAFSIFSIFIWAYAWLPVQTMFNSSNRFNRLSLIILQSLASIQRAFFSWLSLLSLLRRFSCCLQLYFYFFFDSSHFSSFPFHCPDPVSFPLFLQSSLFHKCKNVWYAICKCHDQSYQCIMQPLCPNMLLTDS